MARIALPYTTRNKLSEMMRLEQAKRVNEAGGKRTTIKEIEEEMAAYCNVTRDTIVMIKRNVNQPSLHLGMKICEFLGREIEEVFALAENPSFQG